MEIKDIIDTFNKVIDKYLQFIYSNLTQTLSAKSIEEDKQRNKQVLKQ